MCLSDWSSDVCSSDLVEDAPLRLAEPGHHRNGKCGEHHLVGVTDNAPGHLAAERVLRLPGDLYPRVTGLLPEPAAAGDGGRLRLGPRLLRGPSCGGGALPPAGPARRRRRPGQMPDARDLLPVDQDLRRTLEPVVGQPSREPAPYLFRRAGRLVLLLGTHVIMITRRVIPCNDFSPTAATSHCPHSPARRAGSAPQPARAGRLSCRPVSDAWAGADAHAFALGPNRFERRHRRRRARI